MHVPIVLFLCGVGVELVALAVSKLWPDAPQWVWESALYIGIILMVAGPLWWLYRKFSERIPKIRLDWNDEPERATADIEVFSDRGELNQSRSLSEQLAKASHVHAFWTTGANAFDERKELHRIERLILPNPDGNYLERYRTSYQSATDLGNSIREVTKEAIKKGIPIRWYDDFIGYSLMIGDPGMDHGWAQIEMAFPCMPKGDHPSVTIAKAAYPKIIANLARMFDRLWDNSKPPVDK